ncbi:MAG: hypothetical protein M0Z31_09410 [Clostridia bacterium]|nr:hypothetical protein [Clostridia bacterium]
MKRKKKVVEEKEVDDKLKELSPAWREFYRLVMGKIGKGLSE